MSSRPTTTELASAAAAIRAHDRFLLTTHENPDGDALGSLLATKLALEQLGKRTYVYLHGEAPLPQEYLFMALGELQRELPGDSGGYVLIALDCASESRLGPDPRLLEEAPLVLDIDHHHDNTRFGDINLIVPAASSTGEIVYDLFRELGVKMTPELAEPLYIAIVTDTGRFQYTNTSPRALRLAADLVEAGADLNRIFQGVYQSVQFPKLKLLARVLERAALYEDGRVVISFLLRGDFAEVSASEPYSEGLIDHLRSVEGVQLAALIREPPRGGSPERKVSLRSTNAAVDVSAIARKSGGGGHRQAAGFSSDSSLEELTEFLRREFAALGPPAEEGPGGRVATARTRS